MRCQTLTPRSWEVALKDGTRVLYSYGDPVAAFVPGSGFVKVGGFISRTTSNHLSDWLKGARAQPLTKEALTAMVGER